MAAHDLVRLTRDGDIALVLLDDPDRRNAMTRAMGEAFRDRISELCGDPGVRAVVLSGSGRAFSAGGDLDMLERQAQLGAASPGRAWRGIRDEMAGFYRLFLSLRDLPCPSIAAINGSAVGAGLCVALGCDFRYVAADAQLGLNFARLGLHPGMAATWTLPRLVGSAQAAELLYTGRSIDGVEAHRIGLASRVLPAAEVLPAALATAREIAGNAPIALRAIKQALHRSEAASLEDQLQFEATEQARTFETRDAREGIAAIRERRAPRFDGR
ncbi:enoyl-CoA hydratase/isomerase family protein [Myxococcota bacterium]|nr:enoyl-CoA hydratase/isomerase family protein [Myxococcota bacterium]